MRGDKLGSGHRYCTGHSDNLGIDHHALQVKKQAINEQFRKTCHLFLIACRDAGDNVMKQTIIAKNMDLKNGRKTKLNNDIKLIYIALDSVTSMLNIKR